MNRQTNLENTIVVAVFSIALGVFFLASVLSCWLTKDQIAITENRQIAPLPRVHIKSDLHLFPSQFEAYFNDRVAFRMPLITARNLLALRLFHSSGNHLVAIGKHDWLFYNDAYGVTRAQLNSEPFSQEELMAWARSIQARNDFCAAHKIKYLLVIAPEKGTIYPEQLPDGWIRQSGMTRLEQLQEYLQRHTNVDFVDAESILKEKKCGTERLYFTCDSHWNDAGAFSVASEMLRHIAHDVPNMHPLSREEFYLEKQGFTGDLANMLGLRQYIVDKDCPFLSPFSPSSAVPDTNTPLPSFPAAQEPGMALRSAHKNYPRALVLRDSFCGVLMPFLSDRFSFVEYQWTNLWWPTLILKERPNIVINEIAERHLSEEFYDHVPVFLQRGNVQTEADSDNVVQRAHIKNELSSHDALQKQTGLATKTVTFDDKFELLSMSAQPNNKGLLLKLLWHAKKPVQLKYTIGVHCLDSKEKFVGGADYEPDILARNVSGGSTWVDTVQIPKRALGQAKKLGITMFKKNTESLYSVDSDGVKWGARYVSEIKDLQNNERNFEKTYIASGGTLPM